MRPTHWTPLDEVAAAVRRFNRYYTRRVGLLEESHLQSRFSLTQVRILYELACASGALTASALAETLGLDAGYLSRILAGFRRERLVTRSVSPTDARQNLVEITAKGRKEYASLDEASHAQISAMLRRVPPEDYVLMLDAMKTLEDILRRTEARRMKVLQP